MIKIVMPQAGQSMEEGTIRGWLRKEGEQVSKGEILLEIDTDKATVEVEAPESGILHKILCSEGTTVPVLAPIAIMGGKGEDPAPLLKEAVGELRLILGDQAGKLPEVLARSEDQSAVAAAEKDSVREQPEAVATAPKMPALRGAESSEGGRLRVSPLARRIAQERGIDLRTIGSGSGPGGRILSTDIPQAPAAPSPESGPKRRPMSRMRRAIGRSLQASKQSIPHFYMRLTIDAQPLYSLYRSEKAKYPCTINDLITLACARVVREFPAFRCRIENDEIVEMPSPNIGIAVAMDDGLVVPVIAEADRLSLEHLAATSRRIVDAARQGKMESSAGAVFTISNLGSFGVEEFSAIINPPEAAILAVGAIRESVIVRDGFLRPGRVMSMTLSSDHRIIDGLQAARFLARLKERLEAPESLLIP